MNIFLLLIFSLWSYLTIWFLIAIWFDRNDVADLAWGLGFILMAWFFFFLFGVKSFNGLIVNILVSFWGLRLAWHIFRRLITKAEDVRYLKWREQWRYFYLRSYFQVFLLQGFLLFLIVLPVIVINAGSKTGFDFWLIVGLCLWLFGFIFETISDWQLSHYLKNKANRGKLLQSGLWRYSRHPNYFGEVVLWWGLGIGALGYDHGWIGLLGPITITFLILKVSGIPLLEAKMKTHLDFSEYSQKTNVFIPWWPRAVKK